jgi:hypothetical protein
MTEPLQSAEDHLRRGEQRRACAEVARDANDFALARDHRDRAVVDYLAALATCAIWPAWPPRVVEPDSPEALAMLAELRLARGVQARLRLVADAARVYVESEPDSPARADAYERLFAAVREDS